MKNPKLIDEAWIDEQIQYVGTPNNKYDDALLHVMNLVKSKLQPLPAPTKTNVDKIRAGEMAIENDYKDDMQKCLDYLVPSNQKEAEFIVNFYILINSKYWVASQDTTLPTIKASELIKEIEGGEPAPEWQPKFGEVVEVRDDTDEKWVERIFLFAHAGFYYCVDKADDDIFMDKTGPIEIVVWSEMQKTGTLPTMTLAEAEAKLGVKIIT